MLRNSLRPLARLARPGGRAFAAVGDAIPDVSLDVEFPPKEVSLKQRLAGRKVILVGLPGAFTPTWSETQVPGYLGAADALKAKGIDEVIIFCVNDSAVMKFWAVDQGVEDNDKCYSMRYVNRSEQKVSFMADTSGALTRALDLELTHENPVRDLGPGRCKRFAAYYDDGVLKALEVSEAPGDPAGDDDPHASCVDNMLAHV